MNDEMKDHEWENYFERHKPSALAGCSNATPPVRTLSDGRVIRFDGLVWRFDGTGAKVNHEAACSVCGLDLVLVKLARPNRRGHTEAGVDACIAPIAQALNDAGIQTIASCCGHRHRPGGIMLQDGRELIIASFSEARRIDEVFRIDIHGARRPTVTAVASLQRIVEAAGLWPKGEQAPPVYTGVANP